MEEVKFSVFNESLRQFCQVRWKLLFKQGDYIQKDTTFIECEFIHREKVKGKCSFFAKESGFYSLLSETSYTITLMLFQTYDDLISHYLPYEEVKTDPYTSEKEIIWRESKDSLFWLYSCSGDLDCTLKYSLHKNSPSLTICYDKECGVIRKSDVVIFLFEDKSTLPIKVTIPSRKVDEDEDELETHLLLTNTELEFFTTKKWISFRIDHSNGSPSTEYENICGYYHRRPNEISGDLFKQYSINYTKVLDQIGIEWRGKQIAKPSVVSNYSISHNADGVYVYLMMDTSNGFYKIGISNNPEYRERTLQSEKPTIEKICCKKYPSREIARAIESALHTVYSAKHIRGEWFRLDEIDVVHLIETLK